MIYIHQTSDYGLGNFINLTPTIRLMSEYFDHKIPVYFDLDFVRDCFLDCPFMDILDNQPKEEPYFTSSLVNFKNDCPDYIHAYKVATQLLPLGELCHTYVDCAREVVVKERDYTLFIRGSGSEQPMYLAKKMPHDDYYMAYFKAEFMSECIFTGSDKDIERANGLFDGMNLQIGNIRKSLALIRDASLVIANDSGLAHAAGAMNKNMIILWKNTALPKNCNPGKGTMIKMCH